MVNFFFFPCDYDDILYYTSYIHRKDNLFEGDCSETKDQNLDVIDADKFSIFENTIFVKEV